MLVQTRTRWELVLSASSCKTYPPSSLVRDGGSRILVYLLSANTSEEHPKRRAGPGAEGQPAAGEKTGLPNQRRLSNFNNKKCANWEAENMNTTSEQTSGELNIDQEVLIPLLWQHLWPRIEALSFRALKMREVLRCNYSSQSGGPTWLHSKYRYVCTAIRWSFYWKACPRTCLPSISTPLTGPQTYTTATGLAEPRWALKNEIYQGKDLRGQDHVSNRWENQESSTFCWVVKAYKLTTYWRISILYTVLITNEEAGIRKAGKRRP